MGSTLSDLNAALAEQMPPLSESEALVEANRCLFCYDAPCTHACPTHIDVPRFVKKIATDNLIGSARTIFESNLLGATCARVCPVQELCEGACVLGAEHKPIMIGRLQRHAMDYAYERSISVIQLSAPTGKKVAVIGAGPAGLSCAGELAKRGHGVTVFEKRELAGGLSTYGIISLREPVDRALAEVAMIARMGVRFETGREFGRDLTLAGLQANYDAVFIAAGLGTSPSAGIAGEEHIVDGMDYIERSKMDIANLEVGHNVVVIGAGNTAIDCATIAKRLGAERVIILYRRTAREMTAYGHEYAFAKSEGIEFSFLTQPLRVLTEGDSVTGLACGRMILGENDRSGRPAPRPIPGEEFVLATDRIVKAIGQKKLSVDSVAMKGGYIQVDEDFSTSIPGVYAGGDCIRVKGAASTVMAVQDGKLASAAMHRRLMRG